jgi:eukaryotic-like serine/threonine-protein kinase
MAWSAAQMARMSRLLDEALALDVVARGRWLEQTCSRDQDLATALLESLQCHEEVDSIDLDTLPKIRTRCPDNAPTTAAGVKPGDHIGPYRLVRKLGTGGMAEVWLAQRADGAFAREVAMKLPLRLRLRPDLVQRFARERDVLASLEHVNIARMYDTGVGPDGLPYLVMEYVAGEPLIEWCDARRLEVRERIKLFLQVVDAVGYVHAQRVIHRDLKPSNILVTREGEVRLLDFGSSRVLVDLDPRRTSLTRLYGQALTPDYASPELLCGDSGNEASDVYSLGIVLYELLTGARPYQIKAPTSMTQLRQRLESARIGRPSTHLTLNAAPARATTRQNLVRLLSGDLDAIVLRALSPARAHRYRSASQLADDLGRYLSGRPTEARSNRPLRRAAKFLGRHRCASAIAALAAAALTFTCAMAPLPTDVPANHVPIGDWYIGALRS